MRNIIRSKFHSLASYTFLIISAQPQVVSQPLPLKRRVMIKSEEGERGERHDLEAGTYTLHVDIEDKVTGSSLKKTVDFEVRETNL